MFDSDKDKGLQEPYEVGKGKPPKHTRFKPGQSGNPRGRPKGTKNYSTDVKEALKTRVRITVDGKTKTVTRQRAAIEMLVQKAFSGNDKLLIELQRLAALHNDDEPVDVKEKVLPAADNEIIKQYLEQQASRPSTEGDGHDENS